MGIISNFNYAANQKTANETAKLRKLVERGMQTPAPIVRDIGSAPSLAPGVAAVRLEIETDGGVYEFEESPATTGGLAASRKIQSRWSEVVDSVEADQLEPTGLVLSATFAGHSIVIYRSGHIRMRNGARSDRPVDLKRLRAIRRYEISSETAAPSTPHLEAQSVPAQLRELKALLDDGIIDIHEFEQLKTKIIGSL